MKNADRPASPFKEVTSMQGGVITRYDNHKGLTKREHFAAMAMQGLVMKDEFCIEDKTVEIMALWSVKCADALLKELGR